MSSGRGKQGDGLMNQQWNWSNILLWAIYLALLAVLLPHTRGLSAALGPRMPWQDVSWSTVTAWAAAFAFEAAIAALTHKLAKHIESTPRYTAGRVWLRRISCQYLNAFSAGLLVAVGVSVLANFGHKNILLMPKLGRMRPNSDSAQQANYSFDCSLRKSASES